MQVLLGETAQARRRRVPQHKSRSRTGAARTRTPVAQSDSCGVRTHALADWRLEPAPSTTRPNCLGRGLGEVELAHRSSASVRAGHSRDPPGEAASKWASCSIPWLGRRRVRWVAQGPGRGQRFESGTMRFSCLENPTCQAELLLCGGGHARVSSRGPSPIEASVGFS